MDSAIQWATHSYCKRKQVGAVLVKDNREIASGYNGTITGHTFISNTGVMIFKKPDNQCEDTYYQCPKCKQKSTTIEKLFTIQMQTLAFNLNKKNYDIYCKSCKLMVETAISEKDIDNKIKYSISKNSVVHAEANIIAYCAKHGVPTNNCSLYITLSPCQACAVLLVQSGITKVTYKTAYKDTTGIDILIKAGIDIQQYKEQT